MNINRNRQSQFELFPSAHENAHETHKSEFPFKGFTISIENIIVSCIVSIMVLLVCFSYGVERGKKLPSGSETALKNNGGISEKPAIISPQDLKRKSSQDAKSVSGTREDYSPAAGGEMIIEIPRESDGILDKSYTIQVASFRLRKSAEREAENLKSKGYEIYVLPKGSHSIVCVGKFDQRKEAQEFSYKLKDRYRDLLVRRL